MGFGMCTNTPSTFRHIHSTFSPVYSEGFGSWNWASEVDILRQNTSGVVDSLFWLIGKDVEIVRARDGPAPAHAAQGDVDPRFAGSKGHPRTFGGTAARPLLYR